MKAMIQSKQGSPDYLQLIEMEKPTPKAHQILVRVHATTVTAGDVMMSSIPRLALMPIQMMIGIPATNRVHGHEFAGTVEAVGAKVTRFAVGDAVFGTPKGGRSGAHSEYLCLPEDGVVAKIPANLSFEDAAAIPIGAMTALQLLKKTDIQPGQQVMVYGASGSVGTYGVQIAKHLGATVTAVTSTANRDWVTALGADRVIDYKTEDFTAGDTRYDVIFDAVGKINKQMVAHMLNGHYATIKSPTSEKRDNLLQIKAWIEAGGIRSVIDKRYPFQAIPDAFRYVKTGRKKGNVVITMA